MSLADDVTALRKAGKLPTQFRVSDIRDLLDGKYAEKYLRTALANFAEGTGDYVKRWSGPRFRRVAKGLYAIVE